ncbi:lytic transglycosylase domain-containing protein [Marinilabilia rubra]|uniref:Lytic transglycosylase n=1 Tax=Marinilabilia rubra TaxID=2162893 RepID=A0A2U2B7Z7_9BACT|nr:lytic transglycosylase domain-containing protein [Marinilabilia rubra]PWD99188.1 lytic transglycosylase [Marinilabilia rubra]
MLKQILFCAGVFLLCFVAVKGQSDKNRVHVPGYLVESRVEKLDLKTPVSLVYNQYVQAYIDVYTFKRPDHLSNILARSELYFPLFEEYLDKYDLPLELKYLAVIESALDPRAKSSSGAYGLWQFLYQSSRMFDLKINSYVDERADPVKATDAACRYLKYLYANFNDWSLAIAAYNGGIGVVKEAILKTGGETDYWKLRPHLPEQVRGYVPAFIAVNYAMKYYPSYEIQKREAEFSYDDLHTTTLSGGITFDQISRKTGIKEDVLRLLNPVYKMDYIPACQKPVRIVLPKENLVNFMQNKSSFILEKEPVVERNPAPGDTAGRTKLSHIVARGEFFHEIAMRYQCTVEDLMVWNDFEDKNLLAGQRLTVWEPVLSNCSRIRILDVEEGVDFHDFNTSARPSINEVANVSN